jgi:hypothetical protein
MLIVYVDEKKDEKRFIILSQSQANIDPKMMGLSRMEIRKRERIIS